ncbi:1,2-phenylacetyl-CoA epoxidase subunit PaaC [Nonomuraea jabiensis]|uniref:Ring-1,2-phenylacetyl-CoA epoxidase subunit PaaC n=1 Tax=Nonomuraea jabiensis TaxID=882448 RepID=A0A7W9GCN8_9ACTN|nr:1,2-phenylacetyl-CoA epoxidase subunit PaaC [Nonomuraea jabiensis]MBB5781355.1 ring-1,2-phenylacetyl-CoA epoxidase subunit PaaC [Nonomuraea jabiensis]
MNDEFAGDSSQWAFGTGFEDPLAGVDTTVPPGVDAAELAARCLMLGDDALIMSQRLAEWCSRAPDLEEDIALANMALDLLGQARLLLSRAAAADPGVVPALPEGSPVPAEDALAYFRDAEQFRNVRLAEVENGDFAHVVVRLLLFSVARLALLERLRTSRDQVLAAVAAKGVKEITYHRDWAGRWFLTLAQGTEESRRRLVAALDALWPYQAELTGFDVELRDEVDAVLDQVFAVSGVERPERAPLPGTGRDGAHTDALGPLLAEMQVVARAHPSGRW